MFDIYDKIRNADEPDVKEMTTSGDIAYARGELKSPTKGLDILKDKSKKLNKDIEKKILRVKEQHDNKIPNLKKEIINQIQKMVKDSNLHFYDFLKSFSKFNLRYLTSSTSVAKYQSLTTDLNILKEKLANDAGELELILSALKGKRSVKVYDPFSGYENFFSVRLESTISGVDLIYNGEISLSYTTLENLYVSDFDIEEEIIKNISGLKSAREMIYPNGGIFRGRVFDEIKDIVLKETSNDK